MLYNKHAPQTNIQVTFKVTFFKKQQKDVLINNSFCGTRGVGGNICIWLQ